MKIEIGDNLTDVLKRIGRFLKDVDLFLWLLVLIFLGWCSG